jgi:hypothetical protein
MDQSIGAFDSVSNASLMEVRSINNVSLVRCYSVSWRARAYTFTASWGQELDTPIV